MSRLARLALFAAVILFSASVGVVVEKSVPPILILILVCIVILKHRRSLALWQHGTARLSTDRELQQNGLLNARSGLLLGRSLNGPPSLVKAGRICWTCGSARNSRVSSSCGRCCFAANRPRWCDCPEPFIRPSSVPPAGVRASRLLCRFC